MLGQPALDAEGIITIERKPRMHLCMHYLGRAMDSPQSLIFNVITTAVSMCVLSSASGPTDPDLNRLIEINQTTRVINTLNTNYILPSFLLREKVIYT